MSDKMVAKVSQEMFDNTVRENMEEFDMSMKDAIEDTVSQFKSQGADLSAVIVDLMAVNMNSEVLKDAVGRLNACAVDADLCEDKELIETLQAIQSECKRGITFQVIAGDLGCYPSLLEVLLNEDRLSTDMQMECLRTLIALMSKQPDLLDAQGIAFIMRTMDQSKDNEVLLLLLDWVKECCKLHELNRQHIVNAGILDHLKPLLDGASSQLLCSVLAVLRALVLDDDLRVEFGRAHQHARTIAQNFLATITALLEKFQDDAMLIAEILLTLSVLLVRSEFCTQFVDANGLSVVNKTMRDFSTNDKLIRQCYKLLKALAGNDDCKAKIIKGGAAPLIVDSLNKNKHSAATAALALGCIASLTLRSPDNSGMLYEAGAPTCIIECMKRHPENEAVQKHAGWAIRNMVSHSRHQNKEFLRLGAESLLKSALPKFGKSEYDIKAALRDLECEIALKEEWTGRGGKLTTDAAKAQ